MSSSQPTSSKTRTSGKRVRNPTGNPYTCECGREFDSHEPFKNHNRTHKNKQRRIVQEDTPMQEANEAVEEAAAPPSDAAADTVDDTSKLYNKLITLDTHLITNTFPL